MWYWTMGNNKWGKWKEYFVGDEIKREKKKVSTHRWKCREVMIWFIAWIILHKRDEFCYYLQFSVSARLKKYTKWKKNIWNKGNRRNKKKYRTKALNSLLWNFLTIIPVFFAFNLGIQFKWITYCLIRTISRRLISKYKIFTCLLVYIYWMPLVIPRMFFFFLNSCEQRLIDIIQDLNLICVSLPLNVFIY